VLCDEKVTTHWEDVADLRAQFPQLQVQTGVRWVDEGAVVTSAGISAGIDMGLHLVQRLGGETLAVRTARQMDFAWTRN
jgi:transcriptional regulator GlxA family with amidase domain